MESSSSTDGETRQRLWSRAVERRSREAQQLKSEVVEKILTDSHLDHFFGAAGAVTGNPAHVKVGALLLFFFNRASDPTTSLTVRRKCLDHIQNLRKQLDDALQLPENVLTSNSTTTTTTTTTTEIIAKAPTTKAPTAKASTAKTTASTTAAPVTAPRITAPPITAPPITAPPVTTAPITAAPMSTAPITAASITAASITAGEAAARFQRAETTTRTIPTISTTNKKSVDLNTSLPSKNTANDSSALKQKILTSGAVSRTIAVPLPLPKKSTATFAAAAAATTQLASSSVHNDAFSNQSKMPQQATGGPLQNGSTAGQSNNKQQVPPVDFAPPPYQRHSEIAAAKNLVTKKRSAPLNGTVGGSNNLSNGDDQQDRDENPKQKQRKLISTATIQHHEGPAPKATTNPDVDKISSRKVPRRLQPMIQPVLQLDTRKKDHPRKQPDSKISSLISLHQFPADIIAVRGSTSRFSGSRASRPPVTLEFTKQWPGNKMLADAGAAFEQWEPFWQTEKVVAAGVTSVVRNVDWMKHPSWEPNSEFKNIPRTVAHFRIPSFTGNASKQIAWGMTKIHANNIAPTVGDVVLVLRMLPITVERKYKRANCHLWPKGTFLMVNKVPVALNQRIQVSNDAAKWEKMSYPLDLSSHIRNCTENTIVAMCCQDDTQYLYMVAVCRYKPPLEWLKELLHEASPFLFKMTLAESMEKAMGYMNKNSMITIDEGNDGDSRENGAGKLVFSLVDPVTKTPMKTPVRGQRCKHWQCFDLESFLSVNASVSGGRWRCICCESFITYQELEVCGLTQSALQTFATEVSATRDRIEFRADKSLHLLDEAPLRHKNRQRQKESVKGSYSGVLGQSSGRGPVTHETIEIIDLDDD